MKIKLLTHQNNMHHGPGVVVKNLLAGLQNLDSEVVSIHDKADCCVCLHNPLLFRDLWDEIDIVGPNSFVIPSEETTSAFSDFLVPSQWVKDTYSTYDCMENKLIHVWPVGVDTEDWKPSHIKVEDRPIDCLVYYKNADVNLMRDVDELCKRHGLTTGMLRYGAYQEQDLKNAMHVAKFCILVTRTESQGMAYMQMMSAGIPCFVLEKPEWDDQAPVGVCPATSVPYFDKRCGKKVLQTAPIQEKHEAFSSFLENLNNGAYNPREYILENHTLEIGASNFLDILKGVKKRKEG